MLSLSHLLTYWNGPPLHANLLIIFNLIGALLLGMVIGYERAYHGRAAGVRTYGLVCMASTALTVFVGYSEYWFGGAGSPSAPDPTRIVQGIVTGCSFLCAGVIIKDGLSINGLTTAASLWTAAATGILIGVGFYAAALALALLCLLAMTLGQNIQRRLPGKEYLGVVIRFKPGTAPDDTWVSRVTESAGYSLQVNSLAISRENNALVCRFRLMGEKTCVRESKISLARIVNELPIVDSFSLETARQ